MQTFISSLQAGLPGIALLVWIIALVDRRARWAFAGWFPVTAWGALIVIIVAASMLSDLCSWEYGRELLGTTLVSDSALIGGVFLLTLSFLGRPEIYEKRVVISTILLSVLIFGGVFWR